MKLQQLDGESWTKRTARTSFPILVEYALSRKEITYSEWDNEIVTRGLGHHVMVAQYGYPAGSIGDACEEYAEKTGLAVPHMNLLIVNKTNRVPGDGADYYIEQFCRKFLDRAIKADELTLKERRAIIDRAQEEIFDFEGWSALLNAYGLAEARGGPLGKDRRRPNPAEWHVGPESEAHKAIKNRIAGDPRLVGLPLNEKGSEEYRLWSGDEVDLYFENAALAVEVKTAVCGFSELHRGIFQCVKYKAVLRAQQIHDGRIPIADCVLAIGGRLSAELRGVTQLFGVRCFEELE